MATFVKGHRGAKVASTVLMAPIRRDFVKAIRAVLRSAHGEEKITHEVSGYCLPGHLARTYDGMMITIPNDVSFRTSAASVS